MRSTSSKHATMATLALLAASAADAWGGARGFHDPFYRGAMPSEPRWPHHGHSGFRQPARQRPQQRQHPQHRPAQTQHYRQPPQQPQPQQPQPQVHQRTPTEELTDAFLRHAGDDVVLSSVDLAQLLGAAEGRPRGDTPRRPAVLQLLQQWDVNRDGGLNLNEFIGLYAELQRQSPQLFAQHLANLRAGNTSGQHHDAQPPPPPPPPPPQQQHQAQQPTRQPPPAAATQRQHQPSRPTASASQPRPPAAQDSEDDSLHGRRGKLTYVDIERNERFYSMVFDDPEEGEEPLVVSTVWSTREVGQTDTWHESEVW